MRNKNGILYVYVNYITMQEQRQRKETSIILDPGTLRKIRDVSYNYIKLESSEIIADVFCDEIKLKALFNRICENTDKKINYAIKQIDNKEVVELYLYHIQKEFDYNVYLEEVISLFVLLSNNNNSVMHSNIKNAIIGKKAFIVSYELDQTGNQLVDYLDMYTFEGETHRYNLNSGTFTLVSAGKTILPNDLTNYLNDTIQMNSEYIPNIINDMSRLSKMTVDASISNRFIVHKKIKNKSIGIYCSPIDINGLNTFLLERLGKTLPDNEIFKDLLFGAHIEYNIIDGKIYGFGFGDYF